MTKFPFACSITHWDTGSHLTKSIATKTTQSINEHSNTPKAAPKTLSKACSPGVFAISFKEVNGRLIILYITKISNRLITALIITSV